MSTRTKRDSSPQSGTTCILALEHLSASRSPGSGIHALYISPMSAQAPISTLRSQQGVHKCREKAPDDPANVALNQLWSKWPSTVKPHCFQQLSTTVWGAVVYNSESTVGVSNRFQTVSHTALRKAGRGGVGRGGSTAHSPRPASPPKLTGTSDRR